VHGAITYSRLQHYLIGFKAQRKLAPAHLRALGQRNTYLRFVKLFVFLGAA